MSHAVVVFSFPEPQDSITLGLIIESAKKSFANMSEVKIHLAIKDVADDVISIFDPLHKEDGELVKHAKRELSLIDGSDDGFDKSLIAAVRGFSSYGHSGGSAGIGISILHELLQFHNLSPLTDDPNEWILHTENTFPEPSHIWQNKRNGEAFSTDGGKTYYLLSEGGTMLNPKPIHYSAHQVIEPVSLAEKFIEEDK